MPTLAPGTTATPGFWLVSNICNMRRRFSSRFASGLSLLRILSFAAYEKNDSSLGLDDLTQIVEGLTPEDDH